MKRRSAYIACGFSCWNLIASWYGVQICFCQQYRLSSTLNPDCGLSRCCVAYKGVNDLLVSSEMMLGLGQLVHKRRHGPYRDRRHIG